MFQKPSASANTKGGNMKRRLVWIALVSLFVLCSTALPVLAAEKMMKSEKAFVKDAASGGMMEDNSARWLSKRAPHRK